MHGDERSFRVALVADALVNPAPGAPDGIAICGDAGWAVMQLPAGSYPADVRASALEQVAEHADEFLRRGYALVLLTTPADGESEPLARALSVVDRELPPVHAVTSAESASAFLASQPQPAAATTG